MKIIKLNKLNPPFTNVKLSFSGGINQCVRGNGSTIIS